MSQRPEGDSLFSIISVEVLIILQYWVFMDYNRKGRYNIIGRPLCGWEHYVHQPQTVGWFILLPVRCQCLYYITMSSLFPQPLKCVRLSKNCSPVKYRQSKKVTKSLSGNWGLKLHQKKTQTSFTDLTPIQPEQRITRKNAISPRCIQH